MRQKSETNERGKEGTTEGEEGREEGRQHKLGTACGVMLHRLKVTTDWCTVPLAATQWEVLEA